MKEKILKFLRSEMLSSILFLVFGLLLCLFPAESIHLICRIFLSLIFFGTGLYHINAYLSEKKNATVFDMFTGVMVLVLGIFLFQNPQIVVKLLPLFCGSMVLVDSVWVFRYARTLCKNHLEEWKAFLFGSFLSFVLGLAIMWNPFTKITQTVIFCGVIFLVNGIADLVFLLLYRHKIKKLANPSEPEAPLEEPGHPEPPHEQYEEYRPDYSAPPAPIPDAPPAPMPDAAPAFSEEPPALPTYEEPHPQEAGMLPPPPLPPAPGSEGPAFSDVPADFTLSDSAQNFLASAPKPHEEHPEGWE